MNGPGKWYDTPERANEIVPKGPLNSIFADSVADLKTIVDRILDPVDWLDAKFVGVRFAPSWGVLSRFGLDVKDPKVLLSAAEQIKRLPPRCKLGVHMHFASSKTGPRQWFGFAVAFIEIAGHFVTLCGRDLEVLDLGGGWPSHLLDDPSMKSLFHKIFERALERLPHLGKVMFEPGKSLTERAGALLTKVLEIREMPNREIPKVKVNNLDEEVPSAVAKCGSKAQRSTIDDDKEESLIPIPRKAAIVDACISDLGSMPLHTHPLLWRSKDRCNRDDWEIVEAGKDALWGSICMEFDVLGYEISIPEYAKPGDLVLLAFCGAYDMSMSYNFADGKGRDIRVL